VNAIFALKVPTSGLLSNDLEILWLLLFVRINLWTVFKIKNCSIIFTLSYKKWLSEKNLHKNLQKKSTKKIIHWLYFQKKLEHSKYYLALFLFAIPSLIYNTFLPPILSIPPSKHICIGQLNAINIMLHIHRVFMKIWFFRRVLNPLSAKWRACMTWKHLPALKSVSHVWKRNHKWVKLKSEAGRRGAHSHKVTFTLDLSWHLRG